MFVQCIGHVYVQGSCSMYIYLIRACIHSVIIHWWLVYLKLFNVAGLEWLIICINLFEQSKGFVEISVVLFLSAIMHVAWWCYKNDMFNE